MKKLFTMVMLLAAVCMTANAQHLGSGYSAARLDRGFNDYDVYYGFRIGYNAASLRFSGDEIDSKSISGMNFGAVVGFPLGSTSLVFEPGVLYSVKGGKTKNNVNKATAECYMHGIEIPLVVKYDIPLGNTEDISIMPLFGCYIDLGIAGRTKVTDADGSIFNQGANHREKLKTFNSNRFHRIDAGLRMGCGMNIDVLYVELAYDLGLKDLGRDTKQFQNLFGYDSWEGKARTGNFSISVGVNF